MRDKTTEHADRPQGAGQDDAPGPDAARRRVPAAGPHADPDLTNEEATPGTGSLPEREDTVDPAGG